MRNQLQYAYSIIVFVGVLVASYLMIDRDGNARTAFQEIHSGTVMQANVLDPSVSNLFEMEQALTALQSSDEP